MKYKVKEENGNIIISDKKGLKHSLPKQHTFIHRLDRINGVLLSSSSDIWNERGGIVLKFSDIESDSFDCFNGLFNVGLGVDKELEQFKLKHANDLIYIKDVISLNENYSDKSHFDKIISFLDSRKNIFDVKKHRIPSASNVEYAGWSLSDTSLITQGIVLLTHYRLDKPNLILFQNMSGGASSAPIYYKEYIKETLGDYEGINLPKEEIKVFVYDDSDNVVGSEFCTTTFRREYINLKPILKRLYKDKLKDVADLQLLEE